MAASRARDQGLADVEEHTSALWNLLAYTALQRTAYTHTEFIVDEVWKELRAAVGPIIANAGENRAMGAVVRKGIVKGIISGTGRYLPSAKVTSHKVPRQVWRSEVYDRWR